MALWSIAPCQCWLPILLVVNKFAFSWVGRVTRKKSLLAIPTFIVYCDGEELGRMIEKPMLGSIEADLFEIELNPKEALIHGEIETTNS